MARFKVLVVDDSPFMRKVFSDFISADPSFEVAATASNGKEAIDKTLEIEPDVITMDLEMPSMNGLEALRRIMKLRPTPVIMLSAVTDNGTRDTIRALQYGALDFIRKPDGSVKLDIRQVGDQLREKLHVAVEMARNDNVRMLASADDLSEHDQEEEMEALDSKEPPEAASNLAHLPPAGPIAPESLPLEKARESKPAEPKTVPAPKDGSQPGGKKAFRLPETNAGLTSEVPRRTAEPRKGPASADKPSSRPMPAKALQPEPRMPETVKPATRKESVHSPPETARPSIAPEAAAERRRAKVEQKAEGRTRFGHIVAIGTSTGGPRALQEVLTAIPPDFPAPILIVQHMPPKFTHSLAQRLDSFTNIHVREASEGEPVLTGTAYIAPGGLHMTLVRDSGGTYRISLSEDAQVSGHRPSVDRLFESLVGLKEIKRHVVIMTGMGSDGAKAMKALQEDGAETLIAESERTCVVYGMPRSAVELGAASQVLNLQQIAPALVYEVTARKR
ncbi:chemotaxis response regulator protein-glutamate methylesterase [Cohnella sp. AR92]|uniref:protein-glutamate methylesterase/protein-glutamine glutaminase n=1 Tax=Cohnella sp. AR92 TaxID=648716 RepID=UPI000F8C70C3|nr:chemotaxis response regulator protein-glutamate methylesterase [Cohnella sp. AR92]RUS46356.1 response regulator [Cohnella sp. AR92]